MPRSSRAPDVATGPRHESNRLRVPWAWHLVPVAFVALWIGLAIHSLRADDARFGWGMFKKHVNYRVSYAWLMEDGTAVPYAPGDELRGPGRWLDPGRPHGTTYSVGAVRSWVRGYARYMARRPPSEGARFRATLSYRINREGPILREVVVRPRESDP